MRYTTTVEMRLQALKGRLLLKITGEYWFNKTVDLFYVCGWRVEDVPAKKGLFGHDAYKKLVDIEIVTTKHVETNFIGAVRANEEYIEYLEKARVYYVKLMSDLAIFSHSIEPIKQ